MASIRERRDEEKRLSNTLLIQERSASHGAERSLFQAPRHTFNWSSRCSFSTNAEPPESRWPFECHTRDEVQEKRASRSSQRRNG